MSCKLTDTLFDGFCVVSTSADVSETPGWRTVKGVEDDACTNVGG